MKVRLNQSFFYHPVNLDMDVSIRISEENVMSVKYILHTQSPSQSALTNIVYQVGLTFFQGLKKGSNMGCKKKGA